MPPSTPEDAKVAEVRTEVERMRKDNADLDSAVKKLEADVTSFKAQVLSDNNEFAELSRKHKSVVASVEKKNKTLKEKLALYSELQKINKQLGANVAYRQQVDAEMERLKTSDTLIPQIKAEKAKLAALKSDFAVAGQEMAKKKGQAVNLIAELATHKEADVDDPAAWREEKAGLENEIHALEGWLDGNRSLSETIHGQLNATIGQLNKKKMLAGNVKLKLQSMPKKDVYGDGRPQLGRDTKESLLAKLAILKPIIAQWDRIHGLEAEMQYAALYASKLDYTMQMQLSRTTKSKAKLEAKARKLRKDVDALQGSMSSIREGLGDIVSR